MKVLTKTDLLKALKKADEQAKKNGTARIPYAYKTLLEYEKAGIISRGGTQFQTTNDDRFYTEQEISEIVQRIIAYKQNKK